MSLYTQAEQRELISASQTLLQGAGKAEGAELADLLRRVIRYHDWRYYVQSDPVISDFDYDKLFSMLRKIEEENPDWRTEDSPTQRVARGLTEDFPSVAHLIPMLSLDNSYDEEDLLEFDKRLKKLAAAEQVGYTVEPKLDGSSIALVYEDDRLVRAATRGDGVAGDEITNNAKTLRSIPLTAPFSKFGIRRAEVRGEVVIDRQYFEKLNDKRSEAGLQEFQNPRNTASGALRMKDSAEVAERGLEAILYQLGYAEDAQGNSVLGAAVDSHFAAMEILGQVGFKTTFKDLKVCETVAQVLKYATDFEAKRDAYPFELDGMVIKVNRMDLQARIGETSHHPRWAIAFKFKARSATTTLERVEYQVGRTGAITPVAKVAPVALAGVTISSISLHNEDFIQEKDVRIGDTVIVERAGDVIPYLVAVVPEGRKGKEEAVQFPRNCPSCDAALVKEEDVAAWRCVNADCPAQMEERLIHYASKGAMNIEGMGRDIAKRFHQLGLVKHLGDIYKLDYDRILDLEGWKDKSVNNLRAGIEASKERPLWRLLVGLGIRHVGGATAKTLSKHIRSIRDLEASTEEELVDLEDIGPIVARSIIDFFANPSNIDVIRELEQAGVNVKAEEMNQASDGNLAGKSFLFTGTLTTLGRDQAKEMVEANGGKVLSSVSAKLNYLIIGEKPGSKVAKAQKIGSIAILSEAEFLELIG